MAHDCVVPGRAARDLRFARLLRLIVHPDRTAPSHIVIFLNHSHIVVVHPRLNIRVCISKRNLVHPRMRRVSERIVLDDVDLLNLRRADDADIDARRFIRRELLAHRVAITLKINDDIVRRGISAARTQGLPNIFICTFRAAAKQNPPLYPQALVPTIPRLREDNVREGFFTRADVEVLLVHVSDPGIRDFIGWAFRTGMRKREISRLEWSMLDRTGNPWVLSIPAGITKNRNQYVVTNHYAVGDTVVWDTSSTLHSAEPIPAAKNEDDRRLMWRISVRGRPPLLREAAA